jgi:hypothetical protein
MRVCPVGFAFDTGEAVLAEAKRSAEVTTTIPRASKGQATALAVFLARLDERLLGIVREFSASSARPPLPVPLHPGAKGTMPAGRRDSKGCAAGCTRRARPPAAPHRVPATRPHPPRAVDRHGSWVYARPPVQQLVKGVDSSGVKSGPLSLRPGAGGVWGDSTMIHLVAPSFALKNETPFPGPPDLIAGRSYHVRGTLIILVEMVAVMPLLKHPCPVLLDGPPTCCGISPSRR